MNIGQICHDCATAKGWTPVTMTDRNTGEQIPRPVGMWKDACDVCGGIKWLCAPRDYDKPGTRKLTMEEIFVALHRLDSQPPPGEEKNKKKELRAEGP